jgi:hypothetical protein
MAKIWVKGYTKKDGTKVPGHYRDQTPIDKKKAAILRKHNSLLEKDYKFKGQENYLMKTYIKDTPKPRVDKAYKITKKGKATVKRLQNLIMPGMFDFW